MQIAGSIWDMQSQLPLEGIVAVVFATADALSEEAVVRDTTQLKPGVPSQHCVLSRPVVVWDTCMLALACQLRSTPSTEGMKVTRRAKPSRCQSYPHQWAASSPQQFCQLTSTATSCTLSSNRPSASETTTKVGSRTHPLHTGRS